MIPSTTGKAETERPNQPVNESDYVQLSRLVIEHVWRADHGRADTVHELYAEDGVLDVGIPDRAEGITILTVFMVAGAGAAPTLPFSVGEDHDRFVRTANGWRFVSRHWVELFARGDALKLP